MKRIIWGLEEAAVLFQLYARNNMSTKVHDDVLLELRCMYLKRAKMLELDIDEKFRNLDGLKQQLQCIEHVVKGEGHGLKNVAKVFYEVYDLYLNNYYLYTKLVEEFYEKYKMKITSRYMTRTL